ncbi:ArsR/SmtB family transcription factor [Ancylobacter oerskovii]|uniref:ArsR/SmtB family transcription factor n=1 Tax=Ancylobacter oerskovii TaxID=459519 RepID=A0ABW4YZI1_9HYPH|nr:metalloregulator ArsR/SmtB family transcription factor [Ancylobacter oerskovii]MBS7541547.1 winged helix-turn-helix transcriptional regulator [Ancylobacter oerskovii]
MTAVSPPDDDLLALRLRALGHPARLAILRALAERDRCVCGEIVKGLPLAQSTVSQHLKILKEAGLIAGTVDGPRSCYCLDRDGLAVFAADVSALLAQMMDRGAAPVAAAAELPQSCNPPMPPADPSSAARRLDSTPAQPISTAAVGEMPAGS